MLILSGLYTTLVIILSKPYIKQNDEFNDKLSKTSQDKIGQVGLATQ